MPRLGSTLRQIEVVKGGTNVHRWEEERGEGGGGAAADRRCSSLGSEGKYFRKDARGRGGGGGGFGVLCCRAADGAHVSQPIRSVLSRDRDLVLCGEAGLGGLLKVELLEAVE